MNEKADSSFAWWNARRLRYNIGLIVAGILAFFVYATIGSALLSADPDFEITVFTILFQGIGYLFAIGIANGCFFLGPLSELVIRPTNPERYRRICFRLGFWFSVLLPFTVPVMLAVSAIVRPI